MSKRPSRFNSQTADAHQAMQSLCAQFALSPVKTEEDAWGLTLIYQNATSGLRLEYALGEQRGWRAVIARLVDGSFPPHPIHIDDETILNRFDLRDLAAERMQEIPEYADRIRSGAPLSIDEVSDVARKVAVDVFTGDFSVFEALKSRVLVRIRSA